MTSPSSLPTQGADYRTLIVMQIARDLETLRMPLEYQEPNPEFYQERVKKYRELARTL